MDEFDNDTFIEFELESERPAGTEFPFRSLDLALQVILVIVGSLSNLATLYIYGRRGERFTYTIGILAMAVKDLLFCVIVLPFHIIDEVLMSHISSDFFCKLFHYCSHMFLPLTVYILTLLAIERCVCTCHSHIHATRSKLAYIATIIAACISFIPSIVPALSVGVYSKPIQPLSQNNPNANVKYIGICHINDDIISVQTLMGFYDFSIYSSIILFVAMLLMYTAIFGVVVYQRSRFPNAESRLTQMDHAAAGNGTSVNPDEDGSGHCGADDNVTNDGWNKFQDQQSWLALLFFVSTISFHLTLLPLYLIFFAAIEGSVFMFNIYRLHCTVNPVVYFSMDKHFRKEVLEFFRSRWCRRVHR